ADPGASPVLWWNGELKLDNAHFTTGLEWENVTGALACVGLYQNRQIKGLTGNYRFQNATLLRQPLPGIWGNFEIKENAPEVLNVHWHAPYSGGDCSGRVRLKFASAVEYELTLTASQVNLQDGGRHNLGAKSSLQGQAMGRLHLIGQGSNPETFEGNGRI